MAAPARDRSRANLTPVGPGNALAVRHGAYSLLRLAPRAEELASQLREVVPVASPADAAAVEALAVILAQVERASAVLGRAQAVEVERVTQGRRLTRIERHELARLSQDLRGWLLAAHRYFDSLGLTPTARARLGLDLVRAEDALSRLAEEGQAVLRGRGAA